MPNPRRRARWIQINAYGSSSRASVRSPASTLSKPSCVTSSLSDGTREEARVINQRIQSERALAGEIENQGVRVGSEFLAVGEILQSHFFRADLNENPV